jgi:hypothetical protein
MPASTARDRERIHGVLQRLHDSGAIDLDKPLRDAIPFFEKKIRAAQSVDEDDFWWILLGHWGDIPGIFFGIGSDPPPPPPPKS